MRSILVSMLVNVGDVVMMTSTLESLRRRHPETRLGVLVRPEAAELLRHNPAADETVVYAYRSGSLLSGLAQALKEIRRRDYEYFLSLDLRPRGTLVAWLAGIKNRIRPRPFPFRSIFWTRPFFNRTVELGEYPDSLVEAFQLPVRRAFGCRERGRITLPPVEPLREAAAEALLRGADGPAIALCARTRDLAKTWPKEVFAALIRRLKEEMGAGLYLIGAPEDRAYSEEVLDLAGKPEGVMNLAGRTSLLDLAALAPRLDLAVMHDNGAAHLMANSGLKKLVCLLVSTSKERIIDSMPQADFLTLSGQKDEAEAKGEVDLVFQAVCRALRPAAIQRMAA